MLMGGRIAEEIVFNDITAGASSDIKRATEIARKMVTEWGMSKKLGFLSYGKSEEVFLGRDYQLQNSYSDATAKIIDEEVKVIIDENYLKAKQILQDKHEVLENMAKLLLEKETIYEAEVDAIMSGKDYKDVAEELTSKLEQKRERDEKKKLEQKLAHEEKMQELKEQTAAAFKKVGVISDEEYEMIKNETKELKEKNLQIIKENNLDVEESSEEEKDLQVKEEPTMPKNKEKETKEKIRNKKETKEEPKNKDKKVKQKAKNADKKNSKTQLKNENKNVKKNSVDKKNDSK